MPLVKRNIEPRHLCRGALPEGITSELECVTNSTLAAIIRQLSSLMENGCYVSTSICFRPVVNVFLFLTVSLQDINMKKAFKSSTVQDQQVVSKNSIPNPVADIYNQSDKPPPLNILSPYRNEQELSKHWGVELQEIFSVTLNVSRVSRSLMQTCMNEQEEQKRIDGTTREVKKVRKARNRRQEWNMMAYDKELRPDNRLSQSVYHGASSEGSLSPDTRSHASDVTDYSYPATPNHSLHQQIAMPSYGAGDGPQYMAAPQSHEHEYRPPSTTVRHATLNRPQQPPPPPPQPSDGQHSSVPVVPAEYGMLPAQMVDYYNPTGPPPPPPPPMIPSAQTAFVSPLQLPVPPSHSGLVTGSTYAAAHPPPSGGLVVTAPPPPGPPPPPPGPPAAGASLSSSPMHAPPASEAKQAPMSDARSDLLAAIRMGIQLKKVQEQREQEAKREPVGNDVATILSRRIAVEYSDSDDDSEFDENDWSD
ncbi:WASF3 protein, partial [Oxylabes madagascariensis]|nr:WASF3 protein [Oxylabes madagascariensis]